jgi:5-methyltetrahydrofolate--homocysteine methyltransferase
VLVSAMATKLCLDALRPSLKPAGGARRAPKALAGTVHGDVHDIGKNIVIMFMEASGIAVVDLGIDVAPDRFVKAARREKPDLLLLSCLYTVTMHAMEDTIIALQKAGLKSRLKVIVGGAPITPEFAEHIGADGYGADAVDGVRRARELLNG